VYTYKLIEIKQKDIITLHELTSSAETTSKQQQQQLSDYSISHRQINSTFLHIYIDLAQIINYHFHFQKCQNRTEEAASFV